jgi:hypothetical protein
MLTNEEAADMRDAARWRWARSVLLSMSYVSGPHGANQTNVNPLGEANRPEFWDLLADVARGVAPCAETLAGCAPECGPNNRCRPPLAEVIGWQWRRTGQPWPEKMLSIEPALTAADTEKRAIYAGPTVAYGVEGTRDA